MNIHDSSINNMRKFKKKLLEGLECYKDNTQIKAYDIQN